MCSGEFGHLRTVGKASNRGGGGTEWMGQMEPILGEWHALQERLCAHLFGRLHYFAKIFMSAPGAGGENSVFLP